MESSIPNPKFEKVVIVWYGLIVEYQTRQVSEASAVVCPEIAGCDYATAQKLTRVSNPSLLFVIRSRVTVMDKGHRTRDQAVV